MCEEVTRAFSATTAKQSTGVGPSEAIAHTVSRGHLALISKAYTNTYIQRDGHA